MPTSRISERQVTQLETLALGSEKENLRQYRWRSPIQLDINMLFDGQLHANINNQYFPSDVTAFRAKLDQYPSGTRFNVTIFGEQNSLDRALETLQDVALERGLTIEISSN